MELTEQSAEERATARRSLGKRVLRAITHDRTLRPSAAGASLPVVVALWDDPLSIIVPEMAIDDSHEAVIATERPMAGATDGAWEFVMIHLHRCEPPPSGESSLVVHPDAEVGMFVEALSANAAEPIVFMAPVSDGPTVPFHPELV